MVSDLTLSRLCLSISTSPLVYFSNGCRKRAAKPLHPEYAVHREAGDLIGIDARCARLSDLKLGKST
jgi:hypothetical protein